MRHNKSPESTVDRVALVALGDIMTTPAAWATGKAARVPPAYASPTIAWTPLFWIRSVAAARAAFGSVWESST